MYKTGNIEINGYNVSSIIVKDNDGKIVTGAAAPTLNPIGIEGLGYLSYKANLDVAKLPKGAYTLEYTIEYPVAGVTPTAYKKMTFVQEFKVEDLTVAPATWTNLSGDNAWVVSGTTVKNFVYNSITPMNAAVNGTLVSDVEVANILPTGYTGFEGLTSPLNYKLIYRLYSVVNGAKVYNDGKTDAELLTEYTASTNQAAKLTVVHGTEDVNNSTIKSNVEYGVDIIVILSGDNARRYTLSGVSTVKYATTPEIKLFKKFAADAATFTELEYEIKLDAASNLDMSYVTSNDKPFYLTDGSGKVALIAADNSAQTSMFNRSLSTIEYEILPLSAADVAKLKTSTDAAPTNKPTSLIAFTSIPDGGSLTNVQALVKDAAKLVMHSKVAASGADKVSKIVDATNPTVTQVIKVKVVDIWGRTSEELRIKVKIVNK